MALVSYHKAILLLFLERVEMFLTINVVGLIVLGTDTTEAAQSCPPLLRYINREDV